MRASLISKTVVIPANASLPYEQAGDLFVVKEANLPFNMAVDGKEHFSIEVGFAFQVRAIFDRAGALDEQASFFRKFVFSNTSATDITLSFYIGIGIDVFDARLNALVTRNLTVQIGEAPTTVVAGSASAAALSLAAGATDTYDGTSGGAGKQRKHLLLANADTDITLDLYNADGHHCGFLFPQETLPVATSGTIKVKNNGTTAVAYSAMEIYYE